METQQKDLFPVALKQAALAVFGELAPSAILLNHAPAGASSDCPPTSGNSQHTLLHPNEIERAGNYRLDKRKAEFLAGRIAAKMALENFWAAMGKALPAPLCHVEIISAASGRPTVSTDALQGWRRPEISITHSGEYAAALVASAPCGIDIQEPRENLLRVREKFCSLAELQVLTQLLPDSVPLSRLSLLWTAKEAAKKALSSHQMPGFLELELTPRAMDLRYCHAFTLAVRAKGDARMPDFVTVLATTFAGFGLAICILKKDPCYA